MLYYPALRHGTRMVGVPLTSIRRGSTNKEKRAVETLQALEDS